MRGHGRIVAVAEPGPADHRCWALARWSADLPAPLRVTGASRLLERRWRLLGLDLPVPVTFARPGA